jgi:hypothetical protein
MIWVKRIGLILVIICIGTIIDYIVHHLNVYFSVPDTYFTHKVFYGTLWGLIGYIVFKKFIKTPVQLAVVIAAVPAVLLQTLYFVQGHELVWVVALFLLIHFFAFLLGGLYLCKRYQNIFLN